MAKPNYVVSHPSLYLRVNGKLQEMSLGDQIALGEKEAAGMLKKGFVKSLKDAKTVEVDTSAKDTDK